MTPMPIKRNSDNALLAFILGLLIAGPYALWNGFVASILWRWFVSSTFHVPVISVLEAAGLALLISFITNQTAPDTYAELQKKPMEKFSERLVAAVLGPAITLAIGAIVHRFM